MAFVETLVDRVFVAEQPVFLVFEESKRVGDDLRRLVVVAALKSRWIPFSEFASRMRFMG